jgi:hypothetical protein
MKSIPLSRGYVALVDARGNTYICTVSLWALQNPRQMVYAVRSPTVNGHFGEFAHLNGV